MAQSRNSVVGVFESDAQAQAAVNELRRAGFREDEIGVATHDRSSRDGDKSDQGTHAGAGAVTGALAGAGVGAAWGIGIMAGLLPAIGPVIAGGTLAAIIASAGLGAAAAGIAGMLVGMGIPEDEAEYYETEFNAGRTIVTVKANTRYDECAAIIRRHGGHTQERTGEFKRATFAQTTPQVASTTSTGRTAAMGASGQTCATHAGEQQKVQLHEEQLRVSKQPVQVGEVSVRKEVVTEHKTMEVPVQREEVVIERHPVSGTASSGQIRGGEEIRIPVKEEQVHVDKVAVVKEEVSVGKRKVQDTESVSGDVRKEEVKIEEKGDAKIRNTKKK